MKTLKQLSFILLIFLCACNEEDQSPVIELQAATKYSGTFQTMNADNVSGEVTLSISKGHYQCETSLPYGESAGRVFVEGNLINFVDTLFLAIPAVYGPSYTLSGEHEFELSDGHLTLRKSNNIGETEYLLLLEK